MKEMFKKSAKIFGKVMVGNFLCFFVVVSVLILMEMAFSNVTGYYAVGTKDKETKELYTYYFKDGEDTQLEKYKEEGYTIAKYDIKETTKSGNIVGKIVTQAFNIGILICLVYPNLWDRGYKDRNLVATDNLEPDPLKGLKLGLLASVPMYAFLAISIITKFSVAVFKVVNSIYYPLIEVTVGKSIGFGELGIGQIIILALILLIMPAIAFLGYYLGYKDFSILEKIIYKNKRVKKGR